MQNLSNLKTIKNSKPSRRVGRGAGSTKSKTSGRGHKGYKARTGSTSRLRYEGGQMPLVARIPKLRGFRPINAPKYKVINVSDLEKLAVNGGVSKKVLKKSGILKKGYILKILGGGELSVALTVEADKFSVSAKEAIEKAGGNVKLTQEKTKK
jgi:large subunit ribosomal protein L15